MKPASKLRQVTTLAKASCLAGIVFLQQSEAFAAWQPAPGRLMTRWAKDVSPKNPLPEYPRPTLEREEWQNLNGLWDYAIAPKESNRPESFAGQILVPYPIESALSGVMKTVGEKNRLWYRRTFTLPKKWAGKKIVLHFGAVDWEATVLVNGREVGTHRGGYDGFSLDITSALKPGGDQELVVAVWDPTDAGTQPHGKQIRKPESIWYTSVTGIWQTPWLEPVASTSIESTHAVPDIDAGVLDLTVQLRGDTQNATVEVVALDGRRQVAKASGKGGERLKLPIPAPKLWSPDSPHLYNLRLSVRENGKVVDEARSYFGMRKIALEKDEKGTLRLFLNNKPTFQFGPLDQGWWPDGLYTAPTDDALKYDIEMTKELGFNMARKHVKVEPERWYYWCDKLGLLVWQDMPSGDKHIGPRDPDIKRTEASASEYQKELKAMIDGRFNHPSIVMWVPFNEGWGQFDTERVTKWIKNYDPSRLVDNTSGWSDRGVGDVNDIHVYPGPAAPKIEAGRAGVLGEYGGLGLPVRGHTWQEEKNWGYRSYTNSESLTAAYIALVKKLHPLAGEPGLAAAVYTQTTDVEIEVNGLMTYDRAMVKMDKKAITAANKKMYLPPPPPPIITPLSPTSQREGVSWQYTTEKPDDRWMAVNFDDSAWKKGPGGFGEPTTPGAVVHTRWKTGDIWMRRTFELPAGFKAHQLQVLIHHDEDAEIYLNGTQIGKFPGHIGNYEMQPVSANAASLLKQGQNLLTVHCHQTTGGQYIDVGLVDVQEQEATAAPTKAAAKATMKDKGTLYVSNREPLVSSLFMKLPIGSIQPRGWLRHQLELEANGMTGRLPEISKWCKFEGNAWAASNGEGHSGWEELPYWLKGYGDLGYVLKDEKIIAEARKWIDGVLSSQEADGYFGPRANKTSLKGKPDLWPHMVMLNVLQSFYDYTGDSRVLPFMTKYFQWLNSQPPQTFANGYWPKLRWGDNIESVHWLYNRTGEPFLLDLAKKIHENMAEWSKDVINWHNVNVAQGFRAPAVFYTQAGDKRLLNAAERNYDKVMGLYGQFPGGGFAGDENCRPGYNDPRQGFETCGIVEFMHSFEMLTKISGEPVWSDRCEDLAFNSFPAALTPDWKGLHYLTCANSVQLDRNNKAPGIENGGTMLSYSPFEVYRCCQHNVSHGWPYFAEELWLATPERGLCASLYAPSTVTARVGFGSQITIAEETEYPFSDTITFKVSADKPVAFPLQLRIPRWCEGATAKVNGKAVRIKATPASYAVVDRTWKNGDVLTLQLPMRLSTRTWARNKNAVSVEYGPLTFALKIGEKWTRYGKNENWPEWEVYPTTAWNYGLELSSKNAARNFEMVRKPGPLADNPWKLETVPLEINARARKIPGWEQDKLGLVGKLQMSPAKSEEPVETVSLIPMGAARLRISSFPVIGHDSASVEWVKSSVPPIVASHCFSGDSVEAIVDGLDPKSSNDKSMPRFTWWDHRGSAEWVEWGFPKARKVSAVDVYWFDDSGSGGCRVPKDWKLFYRVGESWKPVENIKDFGVKPDAYNKVAFKSVQAEGLRLEVQLQPGFSGGILEWKVRE